MDQFTGANTVHVWHLNIHQDQIKLHLFGSVHRLLPAVAQLDVLHLIFKQCADKLQVRRVVVHRHHGHRNLAFI